MISRFNIYLIILVAGLIVATAGITHYLYFHDDVMISDEQIIQDLKAMTCEEFKERNSNGDDYPSSEVRVVAKEIRDSCNLL